MTPASDPATASPPAPPPAPPPDQAASLARDLADLTERNDNAQRLANMGDYDWHIATDVNRWSDQLFRIYGYEPGSFEPSYEAFLSRIHPDDREKVRAIHQRAYATGEPYHMLERIVRPDGEIRYLESNGQVIQDEGGTPVRMRGTCVDVTERVRAEQRSEEAAAALREVQVRRRQALQINDTVVQGLAAAAYALQIDDPEHAMQLVDRTLTAARGLIDDWLHPVGGDELRPGDLVRDTASSDPLPGPPAAGGGQGTGAEPDDPPPLRALLVDDDDDIRNAIVRMLARTRRFEIVGEAVDGAEALELAIATRPDVVFLDLAMPVMDGYQALPLLLERVPNVRVVVLSGFGEGSVAQRVIDLGAHKYIEKGTRVDYRALADELAGTATT
ncbi:MAG: PAS domain-containing protein [Jatrophihabitans sp.]|uniref:PAS domain-containing protein n=1 Tax=Jatrophihabitans sp. TaxID=1932789 RepID=UPI003F81C1AC